MTPPAQHDVTRAVRRLPRSMSRRGFLTGLGAVVGLVAAEPVRRYFDMGANVRARDTFIGFDLAYVRNKWVRASGDTGVMTMEGSADGVIWADFPQPIQCRCEVRGLYPDARAVDDGRPYFHTPEPFDQEAADKQARVLDWYDTRKPEGERVTVTNVRMHESDLQVTHPATLKRGRQTFSQVLTFAPSDAAEFIRLSGESLALAAQG